MRSPAKVASWCQKPSEAPERVQQFAFVHPHILITLFHGAPDKRQMVAKSVILGHQTRTAEKMILPQDSEEGPAEARDGAIVYLSGPLVHGTPGRLRVRVLPHT